jgi:hypothetical protein
MVAHLAGRSNDPQSMSAARALDIRRRRPSTAAVNPLVSMWSPEPAEPDRLRWWRRNGECASCLRGLLISGIIVMHYMKHGL